MTVAEALGHFADATERSNLPGAVADTVLRHTMDTIGVAVAAQGLDTSRAVTDYVAEQGGTPQAGAIGLRQPVPAPMAAFLNGTLAHSLDFDDTHLPSVLHPSASVVPAALAAAELAGASGADTVVAVAVGVEICIRLGMGGYDEELKQSLFFERGQHATSICGTIGGAAAAAKLLGLDAGGIADAMGVAVSMAGGVLEANRSGGTVKRVHCGWAAHGAVTAAEMARRGITAPRSVFEGRFGFGQAFLSGQFDADAVVAGLGEQWCLPSLHIKPYPANHFTHAGIDAAINLRGQGLRIEDVEEVVLGVATPTIRTIGVPIEHKRTPPSGYSAQFSGPYTVVAGLLGGGGLGVGLEDFSDDLVRDARRLELMAKVEVVADERCDDIYPFQFPAGLTVRTRDGSTVEDWVGTNRGGPDRPLSAAELRAKFDDCVRRSLSSAAGDELADAVSNLDVRSDVRGLLEPTAAQPGVPS